MAFASFDDMTNALTSSSEPLPDGAAPSTAPGLCPDPSAMIAGQSPLGWSPAASNSAQIGFANSTHPTATALSGDAEWLAAATAVPAGGAVRVGGKRTGVTKFFNVLKGPRADPNTRFLSFRKGFGFILDHRADELGGDEVFVHYSAIEAVQSGTGGFRSLQEVEYNIVRSGKGFQAQNVTGPDGSPCVGSPPQPSAKSSPVRDGARRQSTSSASQSHRSMQQRGHFSRSSVHYVGPQFYLPVQDPYLTSIGGYGGPASTRAPPHADRLVGAAGMAPPFQVGPYGYRFVGISPLHPPSQHQPGGSDAQMILGQSGASHGHDFGYETAQPFYYASFPAQYEASLAAPGGGMAYYPSNSHPGGLPVAGPVPTPGPASFGVAKRGGGGGSSGEMGSGVGGGVSGADGLSSSAPPAVVTGYVYPIGPGTAYVPSPPPQQFQPPRPTSSAAAEPMTPVPGSKATPPPASTLGATSELPNGTAAA
ncbi:BQ2448_155 [Microbotryum intermedium]|uniref:BQ2448_155 protein n=1 Tax=Microbotryum intermedium TaxID=269621 RepID=A0A238F836_9BASI|nr:BQ2448_155 [Microbotryum intermedium]